MGQELRVTGIVINSIDYKEKDKLVTIFTLQLGKITATIRGVKNKGAKLKFASQLFCFADFVLVKKGDYFIVASADQIDSFYDITLNYNKFLEGQAILEAVSAIMQPKSINESLFITTLKLLKMLAYENVNAFVVLVKMLLLSFENSGYQINFNTCAICNTALVGDTYFNYDDGFITCKNCSGYNRVLLQPKVYSNMKIINNANIEKLTSIKIDEPTAKDIVKVLAKNYELRFNKTLKVVKEFML